jgi:hypothetical protein
VDISEDNISMNDYEDDDNACDNSSSGLDFDPNDDNVDIDDDVSDNDAPRGGDEGDYDDFMDDASSGSNGDEDYVCAADIDPFAKDDDGRGSGEDIEDIEVVDVAAAWASDDSED